MASQRSALSRNYTKVKDLIGLCKSLDIPGFYTEVVREASGIDLPIKMHALLPKSREERLKVLSL